MFLTHPSSKGEINLGDLDRPTSSRIESSLKPDPIRNVV